ncbi:MAG: hypothetical protein ABGW77_03405 [Campylobacterales bacterium]
MGYRRWSGAILGILLAGCGYQPATNYQKRVLGEEIGLKYRVSADNPEEGAFLRDGLIENIYTVLNDQLGEGGSVIKVSVSRMEVTPLDYDRNGYPILYRSEVELEVEVEGIDKKIRHYRATGSYDFATTPEGVINHQLKLTAFRRATSTAIRKLLAKIAVDGYRKGKGGGTGMGGSS